MIYEYEDFMTELSTLHPDITSSSLNAIVRKGLMGINKEMRESNELILRGTHGKTNDWIKFFIYMNPEDQADHAMKRYSRKQSKLNKDA